MKGIAVTACIFALISLIFCTTSFGTTEVIHNKYPDSDGNPGELHVEYPDLTVEIPPWGPITGDATLDIEWLGSETIVMTGNGLHHHQARVERAWGSIIVIVDIGGGIIIPINIDIEIEKGAMNEHAAAENISVDSDGTKLKEVTDADVFFRATSVSITVLGLEFSLGPGRIRLEDGVIKFLQTHDIHPAPRKSNVRITTFGRIKSK
jgi:hypothetical protein